VCSPGVGPGAVSLEIWSWYCNRTRAACRPSHGLIQYDIRLSSSSRAPRTTISFSASFLLPNLRLFSALGPAFAGFAFQPARPPHSRPRPCCRCRPAPRLAIVVAITRDHWHHRRHRDFIPTNFTPIPPLHLHCACTEPTCLSSRGSCLHISLHWFFCYLLSTPRF
jgi:hypothetical protein